MIDELAATHLVDFPGAPNRVRCFTHILNLVVKSIMHQFDVSKKKYDPLTDERTHKLMTLAGDVDTEELVMQSEQENSHDNQGDGSHHDNNEGWIDERENMTEEDVEELEESVLPIRFLLTKVSKSKSTV
jgi:hypothetical protein